MSAPHNQRQLLYLSKPNYLTTPLLEAFSAPSLVTLSLDLSCCVPRNRLNLEPTPILDLVLSPRSVVSWFARFTVRIRHSASSLSSGVAVRIRRRLSVWLIYNDKPLLRRLSAALASTLVATGSADSQAAALSAISGCAAIYGFEGSSPLSTSSAVEAVGRRSTRLYTSQYNEKKI